MKKIRAKLSTYNVLRDLHVLYIFTLEKCDEVDSILPHIQMWKQRTKKVYVTFPVVTPSMCQRQIQSPGDCAMVGKKKKKLNQGIKPQALPLLSSPLPFLENKVEKPIQLTRACLTPCGLAFLT
jgi:hypothetical protein